MIAGSVTLTSPGKVNLFLEVGGRRSDGYHDVVTVLQALDARAADVLEMTAAASLSVRCEPDIGVPSGDNLVTKALIGIGALAGREPSFAVTLRKHLPAAAGLGGASSNAAAALVGACTMWGLDPLDEAVAHLARSLGADVPFFLEGGCALFTDRGDVCAAKLTTPALPIVLVNPGRPVSTALAFAEFDRRAASGAHGPEAALAAVRTGGSRAIAAALYNNLADVATSIVPSMQEALAFLGTSGALGVLVSGSGSSVFGIYESDAEARRVASEAQAHPGWWAVATGSSPVGVRVVSDA